MMDNLESTSDKLKIERLSDLVKSLYENIDDLKSRLGEKNITQADKAFAELFEKHWKLEENYNLNLSDLANREELIKESEEKYNRLANVHVKQRQEIKELKDSSLQQGHRFNNLTQEYNEKITTTMNERDYYRSIAQTWHDRLNKVEKENKKIIELQSENQDLHSLNQELRKELEESNHLQLTMRTMYENLYDEYRDIKVELAQWKEYASELISTKHYLHKEVDKLEKEKAILENNAAKHEKEINNFKFKIELGNFLSKSDHDTMSHCKNKCKELEKEIENLTSTISGMENELTKKDFEIDELSHTINFASYILRNNGDIPRD